MAATRFFTFLILLAGFQPAHTADLLTPFSASYEASKFLSLGEVCIALGHDKKGRLKYVFDGSDLMIEMYQASTLQLKDDELQAIRFVHREDDKKIVTKFDRPNNKIYTSHTGREDRVAKYPKAHLVWDRLSIQLKLRIDLSESELPASFNYRVVSPKGGVRRYIVKATGKEKIKTEMGSYQAWKVVVEDRDRAFWFAPELDYLPVQIDIDGIQLKLLKKDCDD